MLLCSCRTVYNGSQFTDKHKPEKKTRDPSATDDPLSLVTSVKGQVAGPAAVPVNIILLYVIFRIFL